MLYFLNTKRGLFFSKPSSSPAAHIFLCCITYKNNIPALKNNLTDSIFRTFKPEKLRMYI